MYFYSNKRANYGSKLSPSDTRRYMKVRGLGRIVSGGPCHHFIRLPEARIWVRIFFTKHRVENPSSSHLCVYTCCQ